MTQSYSAGGSRRTAVFTAIVGFHFGMFLLIASGLVARPFVAPRLSDPPDVTLLPPKPKPWEAVVPRLPGPITEFDFPVPEPHTPLPDFRRQDDAAPLTSGEVGLQGEGAVVDARAPEFLPPRLRLRLRSDRLAALIKACYPAGARRAGEEGRAVVRLLIGSNGKVLSWRIQQSTGFPRLDEAVGCIIDRLVFEPGRRDGQTVEVNGMLPIVFRLH